MDDTVLKFMVLDKDPGRRQLYFSYLQEASSFPVELIEAADGFEAISLCQQQPPHFILLNSTLSDVSTDAFLKSLKEDQATDQIAILVLCDSEAEYTATQTLGYANIECILQDQLGSERLHDIVSSFIERVNFSLPAYLRNFDHDTDIPYRLFFEKDLQTKLARAARYQRIMGLMLIEIGDYEELKETLNDHLNSLIRTVIKRINPVVRKIDTITRFDENTFAVILDELINPNDISLVARKLIESLKAPIEVGNQVISIDINVGTATYPMAGTSVHTLTQSAMEALQSVKQHDDRQYEPYQKPQNQAVAEGSNSVAQDLPKAIKNNELVVFFQPVLDLKSRNYISFEALLRWKHPTMGILLPMEFLPAAEQMGIMNTLSEWMLQKVISQYQVWEKYANTRAPVSINMTLQELLAPDKVTLIKNILHHSNVKPGTIMIEIEEKNLVHYQDPLVNIIQSLNAFGVPVVIDNVGEEFTSFKCFDDITVSAIKLHHQLAQQLTLHPKYRTLIRSIVAFADSMNIHTIAKSVETDEQIDILTELGCNAIQGFISGEPMSVKDLALVLDS